MSGPADKFDDETDALSDVRRAEYGGEYLHEYIAVLAETDERVRVFVLAPELADNDAAIDAFAQVSDQWHNASANANILTIRDRGTEPRPWIAVPDHGGDTLATVQDDLSPDTIETVVSETADALRTLGLYNTVHGHLSPDDIYLPDATEQTATPSVHLGGFGLEAAIQAAVGEFAPTAYTAPEVLDNPDQPTEHTDVYGLAAVTYFTLTSHPPLDGDNLTEAIRDGPSSPPSTYDDAIPAELDNVVIQALSTRPEDRYDSPYAFGRAFLSAFDSTALAPDADEPEDDTDQSAAAGDTDEDDESPSEDTDQQATDEDNKDESGSVTRRAALSLLGLSAIGGTGTFLLRNQLFGAEDSGRAAGPVSPTPTEQSPTAVLTPTPTDPVSGTQQANIVPADGDADDRFGETVAISGDGTAILVGAPGDEVPNGASSGSTYVFTTAGESWSQQTKLVVDDGNNGDAFGYSVAVSSDANTALVGNISTVQSSDESNSGSAYVFENSDGTWSRQTKLVPNDSDQYDEFGYSVALSSDGTTAIIGAPSDDDPYGGTYTGGGSAYVFDNAGNSWTQRTKLAANDGDSGDNFGFSVAVSGDGTTAIIGAYNDEDPNGSSAGSAYVFDGSGRSWNQQTKLTANGGNSYDRYGYSATISADGTTALLGAIDDDGTADSRAGAVYVFKNSGEMWSQQDILTPHDGKQGDNFGNVVAISRDATTAIIGAINDSTPNGAAAGSTYIFDGSDGSWSQQAKLVPDGGDDNDDFGGAVTISRDGATALVGAPENEDPNGDSAGSAHVFNL
ncbi:hypothetical protein [Haloarcula laminariae]|uniref:hypothetical protein n=1 Tax=Haloarcula laminariae TaxID=2961577 RepID=UPI002405C938|nr:hypothetical protein [Halomicroarcula sp. FL173]